MILQVNLLTIWESIKAKKRRAVYQDNKSKNENLLRRPYQVRDTFLIFNEISKLRYNLLNMIQVPFHVFHVYVNLTLIIQKVGYTETINLL